MVAQCFVHQRPERVTALIVSNAGAPDPRATVPLRVLVGVLRLLPWPLLQRSLAARLARTVESPPDQRGFWRAYCA
jgi:pimeloyl-ACP methyl ester carboxylesterase